MSSSTIQLHRVLTAPADRVYRAFLDAAALAKWLPPNGYTCTVHELDARVGGRHRMRFTNFTTGNGHDFGGTYLELVPGRRIRYTDAFDAAAGHGQRQRDRRRLFTQRQQRPFLEGYRARTLGRILPVAARR
jgi:uncharacterized protein YndB with AHSA1/START domain